MKNFLHLICAIALLCCFVNCNSNVNEQKAVNETNTDSSQNTNAVLNPKKSSDNEQGVESGEINLKIEEIPSKQEGYTFLLNNVILKYTSRPEYVADTINQYYLVKIPSSPTIEKKINTTILNNIKKMPDVCPLTTDTSFKDIDDFSNCCYNSLWTDIVYDKNKLVSFQYVSRSNCGTSTADPPWIRYSIIDLLTGENISITDLIDTVAWKSTCEKKILQYARKQKYNSLDFNQNEYDGNLHKYIRLETKIYTHFRPLTPAPVSKIEDFYEYYEDHDVDPDTYYKLNKINYLTASPAKFNRLGLEGNALTVEITFNDKNNVITDFPGNKDTITEIGLVTITTPIPLSLIKDCIKEPYKSRIFN